MTLPIAPAEPAVEAWIAPWCLETDLPTARLADVPDVDVGRMIGAATDVLYCFSGRQFRTGRSRVRPTSINSSYGTQSYLYPYSSMSGYGAAWGFAAGWSWTAVGMGWWQSGQDLSEVVLNGPVTRINEVWVDGEQLAPSEYTLYDGRRLIRNLDPAGTSSSAWPWNQQLQLPLSYPGTWCADEETEILTIEGWRRYDEISPGTFAYVLDPETLTGRFEPISKVNVFPAMPRQMRRIETANHSSLTTLEHRWLVWQPKNQGERLDWRTSETLTPASRIPRCAEWADIPEEPKYSDAFVELVAWFWTEGSYNHDPQKGSRITIVQSERVNPQHVAAIRRALSTLPDGFYERARPEGMREFRLHRHGKDAMLAVTESGFKAPTVPFLLSLTKAQLHLFLERCLDGDGSRHKCSCGRGNCDEHPTQRSWFQTDLRSVRRFEMACALAGIATNTYRGQDSHFGSEPSTIVGLLSSPVAKPLEAVRLAGLNRDPAKSRRVAATDEIVTRDGIVWCPTTPSGTWLARRRGTVYFTGNCIDYEWGRPPPDSGWLACVELATELALAVGGSDRSTLANRVVSMASEGISVQVGDSLSYIREALTSLPLCDLFIQAYNPQHLRRRSVFLAPNSTALRSLPYGQ